MTESRPINDGGSQDSGPPEKAVAEHVPSALFDLPVYDLAFRTFFWRGTQALGRAKSPLLDIIRSVPMDQRIATATTLDDGRQIKFEPTEIESEFQIDWRRAVEGDLATVLEAIEEATEQQVKQLVPAVFENLRTLTEATGRTYDAGGRPISHELIRDMLDKVEMDFDENDQPKTTAFVPPAIAKQIRELPPMTAEERKAWDDMLERKRKEFRARQRTRRIS